jgi:hypothetical protein
MAILQPPCSSPFRTAASFQFLPSSQLTLGHFTTTSQTSLHHLTINWLLTKLWPCPLLITSRHGPRKKPFLCCMCIQCHRILFTETFPSTGRLFLFIKNMLPSNECYFIVCFEVATQQRLYTLQYLHLWSMWSIKFHIPTWNGSLDRS